MLFVGTSIIHPSTEGVFLLCNILDLLIYSFKEQREYETIDDDIAALEEKIASIDDQMMKNATNSAKLAELMAQKEETEAALEEKTERWVYLTDLAERIEEQNQK